MSIRLGVNPLIWTNDDLPLLGDETTLVTCLAEARAAGFEGVEMGRKFPTTFETLGPQLAAEDLALASGWYSSRLLERDAPAEIAAMQPYVDLMKAAGVTALVFCETAGCVHLDRAMPVSRRPRLTEADWNVLAPRLQAVADHLAGEGIALAFHHHMGTPVQSSADVERLMAATDERVGLLLDTGHCRLAGGEPLDWIARWGHRINHVHCKDVREDVAARSHNRNASFLEAVLDGVFTIPGDGDLDFPAILKALAGAGYDGWLIAEAEQDPSVAPSRPLAERSRHYLYDTASRAGLTLARAALASRLIVTRQPIFQSSSSMREIKHFINGESTAGQASERGAVFNPTTGEQQAEVMLGGTADVDTAVAAAKAALPGWAATTPLRRARILFKYKALLDEHRDELARMIAAEHGKVFSDAQGEVTRGIEVVEFACGMPHLQKGEHSMNVGTGVDSYSMYQPVGVCAGITPFNFPAMVPMWMYPVALACGNTFVLKPADKDPSAAVRMGELLKEAGLPDGVFNVVHGQAEAVNHLITHPDVAAVSFVGSTPIAKHIYETASKAEKRVQALGGAKNHLVVMPDADIDGAADALMGAAYGSAGERCMAISVAVPVGEETAEKLRAALVKRLESLRVGPSLVDGDDNDMGPLVTADHREKVAGYVGIADEEAELVVDGRQADFSQHPNGYFIGGSLVDHTKPGMRVYDEEIFGPVLCIARTGSLDEAIDLINANQFANGTSIFTESGYAGRTFAERIEVGMVGINVPIPVPMAFHSFGGWKRSLFGPLHVHGADGVRFYTRLKTITARWPEDNVSQGNAFTMPTH